MIKSYKTVDPAYRVTTFDTDDDFERSDVHDLTGILSVSAFPSVSTDSDLPLFVLSTAEYDDYSVDFSSSQYQTPLFSFVDDYFNV